MICPNCEGLQITKTTKNYISKKARDGHVMIGHDLLDDFVPVFVCDICGFVWPAEPEVLI